MSKIELKTPIPGIFYKKPSPDCPDFKLPGDRVLLGDTLCLIEVMKTFNYIKSDVEGILVSYEVANEEAVLVGQVIIIIESLESCK
jgi:biotin carboxyl carrier protein